MNSKNMSSNPVACLFRSTSQVENKFETDNDKLSNTDETIENKKIEKIFTLDNG